MDNSQLRALLSAPKEEKAAKAAAPADSAEERARKKAKQQASYERRMAIQKRREEALAEANRYTDRAAERRQEESRQTKAEAGGALDHQKFYDGLLQEDTADPLQADSSVSSAPTFAQLGESDALAQQSHRANIAQSKYLGGDLEHTHLVKGGVTA